MENLRVQEIIKLERVSVFQKNVLILTNVNLSVSGGELVYLIGETGSGKSSLLKTLYADLPLQDGEGNIAGFKLSGLKSGDIPFLRRKLGIVFQDFQLLTDRSVNDNLVFVMKATGWKDKDKMQIRISEVLEQVGLGSMGAKMPHQLSGGEQQRVAIARALINYPDIILADEPTGNLDPNTSEDIIRLLVGISKRGTAVLVATHDYLHFRKFPARTLRCEHGKLVEKTGGPDNPVQENSNLMS